MGKKLWVGSTAVCGCCGEKTDVKLGGLLGYPEEGIQSLSSKELEDLYAPIRTLVENEKVQCPRCRGSKTKLCYLSMGTSTLSGPVCSRCLAYLVPPEVDSDYRVWIVSTTPGALSRIQQTRSAKTPVSIVLPDEIPDLI